jgi:hypothetical protein
MTASAIDDARQLFTDAGLAFPPLPADLETALEPRGDSVFGTRPAEPPLYTIEGWVEPALRGEEFAMLGMDGHGVNSWATHFYLSRGPVTLLLQVPAGGAYMEPAETAERVEGTWGLATQLLEQVDAALSAGRWPLGRGLIILQTGFGESRRAWIDAGDRGEPAWESSPTALADALLDLFQLNLPKA